MQPLSQEELNRIAHALGIQYEPLPSADPLIVRTRMSRDFPFSQSFAFSAFSDPATHVRLFCIIKGSATIPRDPIAKIVPINQFYTIEHVEEREVTPRMMLIRYTLNPPSMIMKEGVPDPFGDLDTFGGYVEPVDRKNAKVWMRFDEVIRKIGRGRRSAASPCTTKVTVESEFQATTGAVFMRGLIDHVWLNFFENLMVETRELRADEHMTKP